MDSGGSLERVGAQYWAAVQEYRLGIAVRLSDQLLAATKGIDHVWWLFSRGVMHRLRCEMSSARESLGAAAKGLHAHAADLPAPPSLCFKLAIHLSLVGLVEEAHSVLQLTDAREEEHAAQWPVMARRVDVAKAMQQRVSGLSCRIVPVGQECLPYDLSIRWGLGDLLVEGPFTAGVFFGDGPATAIEDDFAKLLDAGAYKRTKTPSGMESATVPAYGAMLNHERGPYWLEDEGLSRVVELYQQRVVAFRNACAAERVLFVMDRRYPANTLDLLKVLERRREGRPFRLFVLRTDRGADDQGTLDPRVIQARVDRPGGDYLWWSADSYNTQTGLAYESAIIEPLVEAIETACATS